MSFQPVGTINTGGTRPRVLHTEQLPDSVTSMTTPDIEVPESPDGAETDTPGEDGLLDRALTDAELEDLTDSEDPPVEVTFSSQDFDVAGLVRRLEAQSILVPRLGTSDPRVDPAGFQRGFVWTRAQMDRFIESLLLGYPVPGIFLVKQAQNRLLVLDGQQRLLTLQYFIKGQFKDKPFALTNVSRDFRGLTYRSLTESLRFKLDDSYMQATIVSTDGSPEVNNAIYQIFERLNSGGTQLTPHEIRVALAAGPLIEYLEGLNNEPAWRGLYGPRSQRLRDQELILRILALYGESDRYSRPLKTFLNRYATDHRELDRSVTSAGDLFKSASAVLMNQIGPRAFRRPGVNQVNVAQAEAIMVGLMRATANNGRVPEGIPRKIQNLQEDLEFVGATTKATADNDSVSLRIAKSEREFADE